MSAPEQHLFLRLSRGPDGTTVVELATPCGGVVLKRRLVDMSMNLGADIARLTEAEHAQLSSLNTHVVGEYTLLTIPAESEG